MYEVPAARLAEVAPSNWAKTRIRMAEAHRLVAEGDLSYARIRRAARDLGVSPVTVYALIGTYRSWGEDPRPYEPPRAKRSSNEPARAIAIEALALCGPDATVADAVAKAFALADRRGEPRPDPGMVRRVLRRTAVGGREPADEIAALMLDASPLALRAVDHVGAMRLVVLTALVDVRRGVLDAWRVTSGPAGSGEVRTMIEGTEPRGVGATLALAGVDLTDTGVGRLKPPPRSAQGLLPSLRPGVPHRPHRTAPSRGCGCAVARPAPRRPPRRAPGRRRRARGGGGPAEHPLESESPGLNRFGIPLRLEV